MQRPFRLIFIACLAAIAAIAMALYPSMSNTLIGVPTNGMVPSGEIKVDQSRLPKAMAVLQVKLKNVNLPSGTPLAVNVEGEYWGTITVINGQAQGSLSAFLSVGRNGDIYITQANGTIVAAQLSAWKV